MNRRRGKEAVVPIAEDEAGWVETAYPLRSPRNARRLLEASRRAADKTGEPTDIDELRARLRLANS